MSSLPIAKGIKYSKDSCPVNDNELSEMSNYLYRNVLGCLSFLANHTRPDISYTVNIFSQYRVIPSLVHWQGLLKLLGYVSYIRHYKLKLNCHDLQLSIFSDADYAANRSDMVSLGGQFSLLGKSSISWHTFKQKSISLSTMESEFIAMTKVAREMVWLGVIFEECVSIHIIKGPLPQYILYSDNQAVFNFPVLLLRTIAGLPA